MKQGSATFGQPNLRIFCVADGRRQCLADGLPPTRPLPLGAPLHVLDGLLHEEAAERHGRLRGVDAPLEPGALCDEGQREHAAERRGEEDVAKPHDKLFALTTHV